MSSISYGILFEDISYDVTLDPRLRMSWGKWVASLCRRVPSTQRRVITGVTGLIRPGELYVAEHLLCRVRPTAVVVVLLLLLLLLFRCCLCFCPLTLSLSPSRHTLHCSLLLSRFLLRFLVAPFVFFPPELHDGLRFAWLPPVAVSLLWVRPAPARVHY